VFALKCDNGPTCLHSVQLSGLRMPRRPPPPTYRPSLAVATGSSPYSWKPLPPQCRRVTPSLAASGGCSSRRCSLGGSLSCCSSSGAGRSARGLPGSCEFGVGETVDEMSGCGAWRCSRRGAPKGRLTAEERALASLDVGDRDAEGGRACKPMTTVTTGNTDNAVDANGGGW